LCHTTASTKIQAHSLHDALPICKIRATRSSRSARARGCEAHRTCAVVVRILRRGYSWLEFRHVPLRFGVNAGKQNSTMISKRVGDRKSTRLNSSHVKISYAVFCL